MNKILSKLVLVAALFGAIHSFAQSTPAPTPAAPQAAPPNVPQYIPPAVAAPGLPSAGNPFLNQIPPQMAEEIDRALTAYRNGQARTDAEKQIIPSTDTHSLVTVGVFWSGLVSLILWPFNFLMNRSNLRRLLPEDYVASHTTGSEAFKWFEGVVQWLTSLKLSTVLTWLGKNTSVLAGQANFASLGNLTLRPGPILERVTSERILGRASDPAPIRVAPVPIPPQESFPKAPPIPLARDDARYQPSPKVDEATGPVGQTGPMGQIQQEPPPAVALGK